MKTLLNRFWNDEIGSATLDWFVFGTGLASLGVALTATILG